MYDNGAFGCIQFLLSTHSPMNIKVLPENQECVKQTTALELPTWVSLCEVLWLQEFVENVESMLQSTIAKSSKCCASGTC